MFSRKDNSSMSYSIKGCDGKTTSGRIGTFNGKDYMTENTYPDGSGKQGGGYGGGSSSNYSSSSSIPAHTRGLDKIYNHSDVLGAYGNTDRNHNAHSKTVANIIDYCREFSSHCWGSNALDHKAGGAEGAMHVKAINLGKAGLDSNDAANLFYVLRDFNFNLDIINLSGNNIGDNGVACMMNGITSQNKQTLYKAPEWKPYTAAFNTVQKVTILNLSSVNMGDKGVEIVMEVLASGQLPATKYIDLHGNNITPWTESPKMVQLAHNIKQPIIVITNTILDGMKKQGSLAFGSKEEKQSIIKNWLQSAQNNGVDTQNVTVNKDIWSKLENTKSLTVNFLFGWVKCSVVPEGAKSFAADAIIATASKKAGIVNTVVDVVTCYFESFDESMASQYGVQFLGDIRLLPQGEVVDAIE